MHRLSVPIDIFIYSGLVVILLRSTRTCYKTTSRDASLTGVGRLIPTISSLVIQRVSHPEHQLTPMAVIINSC